ncbi:5-methylthioadenosine/S-adenosylhomocysteine deaminase [Natronincola peptidivorans]|uniref:5-methylthioadenosine/S-adenosylhomocysteine deaminase n=1 Tax=Natronincola peptidivorans TaxID=426128 RepID=A0A1I0F714_9FIRM|nr:5'-deoxyadenosine deaminase [Natronincola peptidivorans]SET52889.1 5-methylthioadenosine/S-adenosylhomocysteine deaminase [Natronincola peptidivorans]
MKKTLIKNGRIITMNEKREIIQGDILMEKDRIKEVAPQIEIEDARIIDAEGKVVIPGLIQTHIHLTQTLYRGQADDLELLDWLKERIWPLEGAHSYESNYISAKLGIAELIKGGTTAIIDMGTVHHTNAIFEAIDESGFRGIAGKCMMDYGKGVPKTLMEDTKTSIEESLRLLKKWHGRSNNRIQYAFAPRFVISCTEELLLRVKDLSREHGVMIHTHASENRGEIKILQKDRGMRNISYLHYLGLTGKNLILAHCIWLEDEEMKILAETETGIAHCPNSNLKLASGIAKIPELLEMGATVSLAADGAPCNNNLDAFQEMRSAALIQKARLLSPTAMPAKKVFEMATIGGAKVMGMEKELGSIEVGKKADLVIVNLDKLHSCPKQEVDVISQLVYSTGAADVETTIIDGKVVMENRRLTTLNEQEILRDANKMIHQQLLRGNIKKA